MDPEQKRQVLRKMTYGVYVLTVKSKDDVSGGIVTWVSQASMNPPKIMVGLRKGSRTSAYTLKEKQFVLNIIGDSQKNIASAFLKHATVEGNLINEFAFRTEITGAPILNEVPGSLECKLDGILEGSDHDVVTAEVINVGNNSTEEPLLLKSTGWKYGG